MLTGRRYNRGFPGADDYVGRRPEMAELCAAVRAGRSVHVTGGRKLGKTVLVGGLEAALAPPRPGAPPAAMVFEVVSRPSGASRGTVPGGDLGVAPPRRTSGYAFVVAP